MCKKMKSIVYKDIGTFSIEERPVPVIRKSDDVLVKVLAASICGSDVHYLATPPAMEATKDVILGHECVGEVVAVGDGVQAFAPGDHVIADNNLACGTCPMCQQGMPNLCGNMRSMGSMVDGMFAEYLLIPQQQIVKISKDVPIEEAVFAEPLNCVMGAIKKLNIVPGATALVLGGGPIGILFTMLLRSSGVGKVLVSEVSEYRAKYAISCGAAAVINPVAENLKSVVMKHTNNLGVDIVIDAVGVLASDAIACARKGGQCLLFGLNATKTQTICQCDITMRGLTVIGSYIGGYALYQVARLLESRQLDLQKLVTHRIPMERFDEGLEAMRKGSGMKVVLYPFGTEC